MDLHFALRALALAFLAVPPALLFWHPLESRTAVLRSRALAAFAEERGFAFVPGDDYAFTLSGVLAGMPLAIGVDRLVPSQIVVTRVRLLGPWVDTPEADRRMGAVLPKRAVLAPYVGRDAAAKGMNEATIAHARFDAAFRGYVDSVTTVAPWADAKVRDAILELQAMAPIRQVIVTETECSLSLDGVVMSPPALDRAMEVAALLVGYRLKRPRTTLPKFAPPRTKPRDLLMNAVLIGLLGGFVGTCNPLVHPLISRIACDDGEAELREVRYGNSGSGPAAWSFEVSYRPRCVSPVTGKRSTAFFWGSIPAFDLHFALVAGIVAIVGVYRRRKRSA